jgi:hypothetical protein
MALHTNLVLNCQLRRQRGGVRAVVCNVEELRCAGPDGNDCVSAVASAIDEYEGSDRESEQIRFIGPLLARLGLGTGARDVGAIRASRGRP